MRGANKILAPLLVLSALFAWRDAEMLKSSVLIALSSGLVFSVHRSQLNMLKKKCSPLKHTGLFTVAWNSFFGYPHYMSNTLVGSNLFAYFDKNTLKSVLRGLLMAFPCLLIFGLLLASADQSFATWMRDLLYVDMSEAPTAVLFVLLSSWFAGAYLLGLLTQISERSASKNAEREQRMNVGLMEAGIVLGLVNLLFGVFVIFQLGYLFGGAEFIREVSGLTVAQYARHGFFEMLTVSALAIPILLGLNRQFQSDDQSHKKYFNVLACIQVGLLLLILISAGQRMSLYIFSFGWTQLRLYSSAFMVWMTFVLVWFVWNVLRENINRFTSGAVYAGFVMTLGLFIANPDAMIVRSNLARMEAGKPFDFVYNASLSADAVPALLDALPRLSLSEQVFISEELLRRWGNETGEPWISWNGSRARARQLVLASSSSLHELSLQVAPGGNVSQLPVGPLGESP